LLELIEKEEDFHTIEKYFHMRVQELINVSQQYKQKHENIRMIIDNAIFFRNREFSSKFENRGQEFSFSLQTELKSYIINPDAEDTYVTSLDQEICKEIRLKQLESMSNIHEETPMEVDNLKNFLNFIDQNNKHQNVALNDIPPHIISSKPTTKQFPEHKKKETIGNKINYVIEDLLEAKANSSTKTQSTMLTQKEYDQIKKSKKHEYGENVFLKEFTQKFIKRETIDKKILRGFRKYLKKESSKVLKNLEHKKFWIIFIKDNILPPMKLVNSELKINIEFKSFSIRYMIWLFGQPEAKNLYKEFISKNGENIFKNLLESINTNSKTEKDFNKFTKNLHHYIFNLTKIYGNIELESQHDNSIAPVTPVCPIPPGSDNDNIIEGLYGPDLNLKKDNFLNNYRNRSSNRLVEELQDEEENLLLDDLYFQNSYGDLNVSNDVINEHANYNSNDNNLLEE